MIGKTQMKYITFIILSLSISMLFSYARAAPTVFNSTPITINVTIQSVTWIDTFPDKFEWNNMLPGENGTEQDLTIENIGSTNITYVWFNVTQPSSNPFGSGLPLAYDPANWIVIRRTNMNKTTDEPYFVDTMSYANDSQMGDKPAYFTLDTSVWKRWGRWRIANHEFFWALKPDANGYCNGTATQFRLSKIVHNETSTDSIDFIGGIEGTDYVTINVTGDSDTWGYTNLTGFNSKDSVYTSGLNYCISISGDCSKVRFYKWNADAPGAVDTSSPWAPKCPNFQYFADNFDPLTPGQVRNAVVNIMVPYGVAYGQVKTGYLTIVSSTAQ